MKEGVINLWVLGGFDIMLGEHDGLKICWYDCLFGVIVFIICLFAFPIVYIYTKIKWRNK